MPYPDQSKLSRALSRRFSDAPDAKDLGPGANVLAAMAQRGSCRAFDQKPVPEDWLDVLAAVALASPTKSDLQQRDIIMLRSAEQREELAACIPGQTWISRAPMIAVFCGNNRRQRLLHDWHGIPFANDHFDAVFNAIGDAAIALGAFVTAAETVGLGCCPISAVRNQAEAVSQLLGLPSHVFPFAGLAFGFPEEKPEISMRLPLSSTYHTDRYSEGSMQKDVRQYDEARAAAQPYQIQRYPEAFGRSDPYTWSVDKVRQYSQAERQSFGRYMRGQGFVFE